MFLPHCRRADGQGVKAVPLQSLCLQDGIRALSDNHRNDMAGAGTCISSGLQGFAKHSADMRQMFAPFLHICQSAYNKQCPCYVYGWQPGGENKCAHAVYEILPYRLFAYDVSAYGRSRLAECTDEKVDVADTTGFLGATKPPLAAYAEGVGFVHIKQYVVISAF